MRKRDCRKAQAAANQNRDGRIQCLQFFKVLFSHILFTPFIKMLYLQLLAISPITSWLNWVLNHFGQLQNQLFHKRVTHWTGMAQTSYILNDHWWNLKFKPYNKLNILLFLYQLSQPLISPKWLWVSYIKTYYSKKRKRKVQLKTDESRMKDKIKTKVLKS